MRKALQVAGLGDDGVSHRLLDAAECLQSLRQGKAVPRSRLSLSFEPVAPTFPLTDGVNQRLQPDLLCVTGQH